MCALACAAQAACSPVGETGDPAATVTIHIDPEGYVHTRSSFTWDEDSIRDIEVVVTTEDGEIHDILYSDSPADLHFTGTVGRLYKLWAAANLGGKVEAGSLADFTEGVRNVTTAGIEKTGIPMFSDGSIDVLVAGSGSHASIPLKRMMARVDFSIDTRFLEHPDGFHVSSVGIFNPVDAYIPFAGDIRKDHAAEPPGYVFDSAAYLDVILLNQGGTIRLYTFENMQGTLLPGNTDPWRKVPSSISGTGPCCTFLEVVCSYETDTDSCDDIKYRMYLGEDATTNFDVRRNTVYKLTLEPTEEEIRGGSGSWKIETGEWEDNVEVGLVIKPPYMKLTVGEYGSASSYYRLTYPDGRTEDEIAHSYWSADPANPMPVDFIPDIFMGYPAFSTTIHATGVSPGTVEVTASTTYGDSDLVAVMQIEVTGSPHNPVYSSEFEYELIISPGSVTVPEGETVSLNALYIEKEYLLIDGVRIGDDPVAVSQTDVTDVAEWSVIEGDEYISASGAGVFGWKSGPGEAVISATYDGVSGNAVITTLEHDVIYSTEYEYELVVSPDQITVAEGGNAAFEATYIEKTFTLADGVRTSNIPDAIDETDVTEIALWQAESGVQFVTNRGGGVFEWASGPGETVISAIFNDCTDTALIKLLEHDVIYSTEYEYELVVSPDQSTVAEGGTAAFEATYIEKTFTLADGVRISDRPDALDETDVTEIALWQVGSGSQFVTNLGEGVFGWANGPGEAVISATYGGQTDEAVVTTLEHEVIYTTEFEYELVVSPDRLSVAEGGTAAFEATYIEKTFSLADGVRISDLPDEIDETDVTDIALWQVGSGSQFVNNQGGGVFGWANGPGEAVISATYGGQTDEAVITTLEHEIVYSTEYERELVVSPYQITVAEGGTAAFEATYIEKTFTLADGVRISDLPDEIDETDVTDIALWQVGSGSQFVTNQGGGVFGWASGPGDALISATYGGQTDEAVVTTLEHEVIYTTEFEYELVISPELLTVAEGGTAAFEATYIKKAFTLADGVRVSDRPDTVNETDVTEVALWQVESGSQFVTNLGGGVFGWASGPGNASITASWNGCSDSAGIITAEPDPVPVLTASVAVQDTWGGNEYPVVLTYDDGRGNLMDVTSSAECISIDCGRTPDGLIGWNDGCIVAKDWWGMSGAWVTASPTYTMTLSYGGLSVEISGTMHGFIGAEISPTKGIWHYREVEDNGWSAPPVNIVLVGSERMEVSDDDRFVDDSDILDNGIIGVGDGITLYVEFTDPSNGYGRSGSTSFSVVTNVTSLHAYINVYFTQGTSGRTSSISISSSTSGAFLGNAGIIMVEDGYPPYGLVVQQDIWYVDYRGDEHHVTSLYGQDDYTDHITISDEWSLETQWDASIRQGESHLIEIDVNGFSASWQWGYVGG